jgi:hypothetical protein
VLTFCFVGFCLDGFLVISFCLHFVVVTLYLHFATPKYFFPSFQVLFLFFALSFCVIKILFLGVIIHVFSNALYMLAVEKMTSTNATPIIIKKMVDEQDEFMSSTNTPMGSPFDWITMGI